MSRKKVSRLTQTSSKTDWRIVVTKGVNADLVRISSALRGVAEPILTTELQRDTTEQKRVILEEGITYGDEGNYFKESVLGSTKVWIIVDDYGETGLDGQPNPGVHTYVQTILFPEEY